MGFRLVLARNRERDDMDATTKDDIRRLSAEVEAKALAVRDTRAVLKLTTVPEFCEALCSGGMPTEGIAHFDLRADIQQVIIRGTLLGVAAASTFLYRYGCVR